MFQLIHKLNLLFHFVILTVLVIHTYPVQSEQHCLQNKNRPRTSKPFLDCVVSVETLVRDGPAQAGIAEGSTYLHNITVPSWFNPELAAIGQKFAQKNAAGIYYGAFLFSIFFFADTDIRRVVVHTGKSTEPEKAFRRYLTNFLHAQMWFHDDIRLDSTNIFESLNGVRARHLSALQSSNEHKAKLRKPLIPEPAPGKNPYGLDMRIWKAFQKDLEASKYKKPLRSRTEGNEVKFNQYGLAIGHFLHFGIPVMVPKKVLISDATEEELMGFLHLGAFIGRAVGVDDEYNICLQPDVESAKKYLRSHLEEYLVPTLFHLDYEAKVMFEAIFKGFNNAFSASQNDGRTSSANTIDFFLLRLLEDILEIPAVHICEQLSRPVKDWAWRGFSCSVVQRYTKWLRDLQIPW